MLNRIIVFLACLALISGFFIPVVMSNGNPITGWQIVTSNVITNFSIENKLLLAMFPLLGIWSLLAFFGKWHSLTYYIPSLLVLAGYGYLIYANGDAISSELVKLGADSGANIISQLLAVAANGLYILLGSSIALIVFGFFDPLKKKRPSPTGKKAP